MKIDQIEANQQQLSSVASTSSVIWKTEGPTDMLALLSLRLPENHRVVTNVFGAGENPNPSDGSKVWILEQFRGKIVYVVHDCDSPGQDGAMRMETLVGGRVRMGWAHALATVAAEVRNVILPYPIEDGHGKDLRDWAFDRIEAHKAAGLDDQAAREATYADLLELAVSAEIVPNPNPGSELIAAQLPAEEIQAAEQETALIEASPDESSQDQDEPQFVLEAVDDPHRLARINLEVYKGASGRELRYWNGAFYIWKKTHYTKATDSYIRARVNAAVKREFDSVWADEAEAYREWKAGDNYDEGKDKGEPVCRKVSSSLVHNVLEATKSMVTVAGSIEMPCWLEDRSTPHLLAMQNGLLNIGQLLKNIENGEPNDELADNLLFDHSPEWFSTLCLDYEYLNNAFCPKWIDYLDSVMEGDTERIDLLQEWAGYLLTTTDDLQRFICLEGDGGNGKTVFLAGIEAMVGQKNVSHVPLECFSRPFDLASTIGKVANIVGDIGEIDAVAEGVLKRYTGGDSLYLDRKGVDGIEARPTAKLMFAWNSRPNFRDRTDGVWRRLILVPFDYKIPKEDRVTGMDRPDWWVSQGEAPGILNWAIGGLYRLKVNGEFTIPEKCQLAMDDYRRESNPAGEFLTEMVEPSELSIEHAFVPSEEIYTMYTEWSRKMGMFPLGSRQFFRELKKKFPKAERKNKRDGIDRRYGYDKIKFVN